MSLETFFDNFEPLLNVPNGVQKLRELILQLAFQGKLLSQDHTNEPASVLLEKIETERKQQVKERKIRKTDSLLPLEAYEIPFELPCGWEWTRLGYIYEFAYGKSLPEKTRNEKGKVPVYGSNGIVGYHDKSLVTLPSLIVGRKGSVGAVNISYEPFWPIDTTYYVTPSRGINLLFSYYLITELDLKRFDKSTAIPGLNRQDAYSLLVGLPPEEEQKRIVAKVDQLMALCDDLETRQKKRREGCVRLNNSAIDQLLTTRAPEDFSKHWQRICDNFDLLYSAPENIGKLRQAILQLAVQGKLLRQEPNDEPASVLLEKIKAEKEWLVKKGKIKKPALLLPIAADEVPFDLPREWEWVRLGDVLLKLTDGTHYSPPNSKTGDYRYVTAKNIKPGKVDLTNITYVSAEVHSQIYARCDPEYGDILYIKDGATTGIVAINDLIEPFSMLSSVALLKNPSEISNRYLFYVLSSPYFYSLMRDDMSGVAITRITLTKLNKALIPVTSIQEQKRIVAKVEQLMDLCDALEAKLTQSQMDGKKLMEAAMHQASAP